MDNQPLSDRELLEYAAKAVGVEIHNSEFVSGPHLKGTTRSWNPLTSDADAFRLMIELGLAVDAYTARAVSGCHVDVTENQHKDAAATRRAIVRAAAEIGRGILEFPSLEKVRRDWGLDETG